MLKKGIKIRNFIGLLVIVAILITVATTWTVSSLQFKNTLTEGRLQQNYQYSKNVAESTSRILNDMKNNLTVLANIIGTEEFTQSDLEHWLDANDHYFNSLFTTDENGVVQLMGPLVLSSNENEIQPGVQIQSPLMEQALKNQQPFISDPYHSQTGTLMLLVSEPIFDANGQYKGVVDGTIYLEDVSSLERQLNHHDFLEETTVFVVDRTGKIIYHPDKERINDDIADHPLITEVIKGNSGANQIINKYGEEYFSGYGYIAEAGWGVVTQTPITMIDEPLYNIRKEMIIQSLPGIAAILFIALVAAHLISKPINQLSRYSRDMTLSNKIDDSHEAFKTSIYEVRELSKDIQKQLKQLTTEIQVDGLTNLYNRRTFNMRIEELVTNKQTFSLILLDIDHFKKVNDTYGHLVGDDVLRFLADLIKDSTEGMDHVKVSSYRYGGEEYAVLIENQTPEEAFYLAERLRKKVAVTSSPTGKPINISLGISGCYLEMENVETIINQADIALYQSKNTGRNRTTIYEDKESFDNIS